ncbi:uncharacterized protein [Primulina eburnea]|uniref:uncharacterized protein n=1 Tax=Primulina eburnea TaxID=1245227 RepID=UPI003C6C1C7E
MSAFRTVINSCMLSDLNCTGDLFTWCNRRKNNDIIFERLDRFLCNNDWQLLYPAAEVSHLDFYSSDHRLISVSLKKGCEVLFKKGPKRFMFEHKCMLEEDFHQVMNQWMHNDINVDLPNALFQFSGVMKNWAGSRFSDLSRKIEFFRKELNGL